MARASVMLERVLHQHCVVPLHMMTVIIYNMTILVITWHHSNLKSTKQSLVQHQTAGVIWCLKKVIGMTAHVYTSESETNRIHSLHHDDGTHSSSPQHLGQRSSTMNTATCNLISCGMKQQYWIHLTDLHSNHTFCLSVHTITDSQKQHPSQPCPVTATLQCAQALCSSLNIKSSWIHV